MQKKVLLTIVVLYILIGVFSVHFNVILFDILFGFVSDKYIFVFHLNKATCY